MKKHFGASPPHLAFFVMLMSTTTSIANPVTFITRAPSDEAAITVEVDQNQLLGALEKKDLTNLIEAGRQLFDTKFTTSDGVGRPLATQATIPTHFKHPRNVVFQRTSGPESNSCTSCHNDPIAGGAGDFTANAFTSEGTESADFDTVDPQFSNERGTNHMFGAGLIELLAREMSYDLHDQRKQALNDARTSGAPVTIELSSKDVNFGVLTVAKNGEIDVSKLEGIDPDLTIRPFSQKGVIPSLRMFTLNALNAHHGIQADERFGPMMTQMTDFDGDGHTQEFSTGQVSALVAYQATLPAPRVTPFENEAWQASAKTGQSLFEQTGCTSCHMPSLPLNSLKFADPGPFDTAGTLSQKDVAAPVIYDFALLDWAKQLPKNETGQILVPLFGDLKRHVIADAQHPHFSNELMGQGFVPSDTFLTGELWGIADTAPYGHRGDLTQLTEVILAHGGEASASRENFEQLSTTQRGDLITYLKTLRVPQ